jgi:hypothetical protein
MRLQWHAGWAALIGLWLLWPATPSSVAQTEPRDPGARAMDRADTRGVRDPRSPSHSPNADKDRSLTPFNHEPSPARPGFSAPPAGEARFLPNELVLEIAEGIPPQTLEAIARRHH